MKDAMSSPEPMSLEEAYATAVITEALDTEDEDDESPAKSDAANDQPITKADLSEDVPATKSDLNTTNEEEEDKKNL